MKSHSLILVLLFGKDLTFTVLITSQLFLQTSSTVMTALDLTSQISTMDHHYTEHELIRNTGSLHLLKYSVLLQCSFQVG